LILSLAESSNFEDWLQPSDFVAFTLIIAVSNINVLEHEHKIPREQKTVAMGLSLVEVVFAAAIFAAACVQQLNATVINLLKLSVAAFILGVASLILSFAVWHRLAYFTADEAD
jgi:hypothetical protein